MFNQKVTLLYTALSAVYCVILSANELPLAWLVKVLPILLLIGLCVQAHKFHNTQVAPVLIALCLSMTGDILLAIDRDKLFVFGLAAFLLAHISYIFSFKPFKTLNYPVAIALLIFSTSLFSWLSPQLGHLFIPVLLYLIVIMLMVISAFSSEKRNLWLMLGSTSFVISDSIIAIDKFAMPVPLVGFSVMATYYFAQYALIRGLLTYDSEK